MSETDVDAGAVRRALSLADVPTNGDEGDLSVQHVERGVNEVFVVTYGDDHEPVVCKFAEFSWPVSFRAGVAAYRLLGEYTELPVPEVYALRTDPPEMEAFHVTEYLPGEPLDDATPEDTTPARALGEVIAAFRSIPRSATDGYGMIREQDGESGPEVVADSDSCADMLIEYGAGLYEDSTEHDALASLISEVPDYLRANSERFPTEPDPAVVVTDFGASNLLAPGGTLAGEGSASELTGLIDLERARLGPIEFTAVNAEYLMTRGMDDPGPVVEALYDPLPFGPDVPNRDLYWLVAMGRSVHALETWYEQGSDEYLQRGTELANEIERTVG
jgi:aminoglycoside phosphotransferase (APT) family kinase protein